MDIGSLKTIIRLSGACQSACYTTLHGRVAPSPIASGRLFADKLVKCLVMCLAKRSQQSTTSIFVKQHQSKTLSTPSQISLNSMRLLFPASKLPNERKATANALTTWPELQHHWGCNLSLLRPFEWFHTNYRRARQTHSVRTFY